MRRPRKSVRRDDVVTLGTYAKALGIGRTLAYWQARSQEIPAFWRAGRYELAKADFERLLTEHQLRGAKGALGAAPRTSQVRISTAPTTSTPISASEAAPSVPATA